MKVVVFVVLVFAVLDLVLVVVVVNRESGRWW